MTHAATLRLGELLMGAGLVDRNTLEEALRRQAVSGARLGEVLVGMGELASDELPALLDVQAGLRVGAAQPALGERLRIGRLLVEAGEIDAATLDEALRRSRSTGRRVGETLVEAGALSARVLQRGLERQRRLAAVALAGLALMAGLPAPALAGDKAQVNIVATVLERAFVERQQLPHSMVISSQDVARGYVDLDQPVEVAIRTNHRAGVLLGVSLNSQALEAVDVQAAHGGEVRAGSIYVPQGGRGMRLHTVWLKLRLKLAPSASPGIIAHPVALSLAPA
jgi:hypothetical protein